MKKSLLFAVIVSLMGASTAVNAFELDDRRVDGFGIRQVFVPAGCFQMGSSDSQISVALNKDIPDWAIKSAPFEKPIHKICITNGYWFDETEVTNQSFKQFVGADGYLEQKYWSIKGWAWLQSEYVPMFPMSCDQEGAQYPRACINWYEAQAYATWRGGRLPSEAEWEYAARGPESFIYPWGDDWNAANAHILAIKTAQPVAGLPQGKSWVGAYDMSGNVMEWVNDWLEEGYYLNSPENDPKGPKKGFYKIEKGGWWGSNTFVARSAFKYYEDPPIYQDHHIGFRIVSAE